MEEVVICGANAYEQKYYFNKDFDRIPDEIKDELHVICVLFTEEVGGIFTIGFDEEGELKFTTQAADEDYLYDDVSAGLLVSKIRSTRQEMLESLQLFYRAFVLGEDFSEYLKEEEEQ
ncbi:MAG: DUF6145 family protein [Lachnospiraceae bacterium]|nr:DUF6145 family protein [Lachnospiraceae bacterium]